MSNTFTQIAQCVEDLASAGFSDIHARLPIKSPLITTRRATQIRSTKSSAHAYGYDELGNITVLHRDGRLVQYLSHSEAKAAGVTF